MRFTWLPVTIYSQGLLALWLPVVTVLSVLRCDVLAMPGRSMSTEKPAEVDNTLVWVLVSCVLGQLTLLALAFVVGFVVGRRLRPSIPALVYEVKAEELTIESLKARLKNLRFPTSGQKAELVDRYEKATAGTKLVVAGTVAAGRPRAGVQMD